MFGPGDSDYHRSERVAIAIVVQCNGCADTTAGLQDMLQPSQKPREFWLGPDIGTIGAMKCLTNRTSAQLLLFDIKISAKRCHEPSQQAVCIFMQCRHVLLVAGIAWNTNRTTQMFQIAV
jgi:hypothetical protein